MIMNKICTFIAIVLLCISCSKQSEYERVITEALEVTNGTRTDLQIKYSKLEVSNVSIADSIAILKERFEKERSDLLTKREQEVQRYKDQIAGIEEKSSQDVADYVILKMYKTNLADAEVSLQKAKDWKPDYLNRYDSRNPSEVIAKKANATLSFFNPKLQTRQEMSPLFILSPDGKKVIDVSKSK
jgi:hypothetical protein